MVCPSRGTGCGGQTPKVEACTKYVRGKWPYCIVRKGSHGIVVISCCVSGGCLLSLSVCRWGFQDLLKVRPSSLFMLCRFISNSLASLICQPMYPVFAERSIVSYSLIMWSWLMLCSVTGDLSVCASHVYCVWGNHPKERI